MPTKRGRTKTCSIVLGARKFIVKQFADGNRGEGQEDYGVCFHAPADLR